MVVLKRLVNVQTVRCWVVAKDRGRCLSVQLVQWLASKGTFPLIKPGVQLLFVCSLSDVCVALDFNAKSKGGRSVSTSR